MVAIYEMEAVDTIPESRKGRRSAKRVSQLRAFIESGEKQIRLKDVRRDDVWSTYSGLCQASKREEFAGRIRVMKDLDNIYLVREG